jgi:hypothetical protein
MEFPTHNDDDNEDANSCEDFYHRSSNLHGEHIKFSLIGGRYLMWFEWKGNGELKETTMMIRSKR